MNHPSLDDETTKNNGDDDEGGTAPNVEMFLCSSIKGEPRESYKPIIVPSPQGGTSATRRRWKLLKNIRHMGAFRRTSLTKAEEKLMHSISSSKDDGNKNEKKEPLVVTESSSSTTSSSRTSTTMNNDDDATLTSARQQLASSIHKKRMSLTPTEQSFLRSLTQASTVVSLEQLEQVDMVLHKDPLYYDSESITEEQDEDDEEAVKEFEAKVGEPGELVSTKMDKKRRPQLLVREKDDDSFRTELWTQYTSTSSLLFQDEMKKQEEKKKTKKSTPPPPKKNSFFQFFFQNKNTNDEERDEQEEIVNEQQQQPIVFTILATSADDKDCQPHVLSPPIMDALRPHLPFVVQQDNFWLKYSMIRDGASMRSLLEHVRNSTRTIIAIETMDGDVFGSFTSSPWRPRGRHEFYGSGEAFLWRLRQSRLTPTCSVEDQIRLESDIDVFTWTGQNRNVQSLINPDSQLVLGGAGTDDSYYYADDNHEQAYNNNDDEEKGGSGLMISSTLERGWSDPCMTFNSPSLITTTGAPTTSMDNDMFEIANIEVWTLTPVESLDLAEKLELGRQFVFDHGNFVEQ